MYHRGRKWEEYLEHQGFKDDIVHGLERQAQEIVRGQQQAAQQVAAAQQRAAEDMVAAQRDAARELSAAQRQAAWQTALTLDRGFGELIASQKEMSAILLGGYRDVARGLGQVAGSIEGLRADFSWAMGHVLWAMVQQSRQLDELIRAAWTPDQYKLAEK